MVVDHAFYNLLVHNSQQHLQAEKQQLAAVAVRRCKLCARGRRKSTTTTNVGPGGAAQQPAGLAPSAAAGAADAWRHAVLTPPQQQLRRRSVFEHRECLQVGTRKHARSQRRAPR